MKVGVNHFHGNFLQLPIVDGCFCGGRCLKNDHGIQFALHNDTPVTPISPLMDVFSAVNRLTSSGKVLGPDQRIGVMDALRGVTINGARMQRLEDKLGSLEPGKLADLVILDRNPLEVPPVELKDILVEETIVGGKTVYKKA